MDGRLLDSVAYRFLDASVAKDPDHPAFRLDTVAASLPAYPPLRDVLLERVAVALREYVRKGVMHERDLALEACLAQVCRMAKHREPREAFLKWILTSLGTKQEKVYLKTNGQDPVLRLLAAIVDQVLEKPETREEEPYCKAAMFCDHYTVVAYRRGAGC